MDDILLDTFDKLLAAASDSQAIRKAEQSTDATMVWETLESSGFCDAMLDEEEGGAKLTLEQVFPLVVLAGRYALPSPVGETMLARALLATDGISPPKGPVLLWPTNANATVRSLIIPHQMFSTFALTQTKDRLQLRLIIKDEQPNPYRAGGGAGTLGDILAEVPAPPIDLFVASAAFSAAKMAGAMARILDMSLDFIGQRRQFGRPLGKFQALQHQAAIMAEQAASAMIAARIGFAGANLTFDPLRVAVAKMRTSEAALLATNIAHALHGAMGISEEYDLQLYTRRLHEWRVAFGSESFWAEQIGKARLAAQTGTTADFIRTNLEG